MYPAYDDPQMQAYFCTLPAAVQEALMQSGAQAGDVNQLEALVRKLTQK
ncbi:MAG: hypothetical protein PHD32_05625 [Eubacteriales bacterium]|nr:hypothetical protein [Eubacteriales bacterium]